MIIGFLCLVYIFLLVLFELFDKMLIIGEVYVFVLVIDYNSEINDKLEWIINIMYIILFKVKIINVDFCKCICFNFFIIFNVYLFL